MGIDLYYDDLSPFCNSVRLLARALGLQLDLKERNTDKDEQLTPEYIQMNPQHTVPTINDDGYIMTESRAILRYLVGKYGKDDSLYPKDLKDRAIVDQRLDFDAGTLSARWQFVCMYPVVKDGKKSLNEAVLNKLDEALGILDIYIKKSGGYVAGNHLTIADFAIVGPVSCIEMMELLDVSRHEHVWAWLSKCKAEMNGYEEENGCKVSNNKEWIRNALA
ncbi:unnamed protein product [Darwinula stevensoni]|uniref:Glutathione S-transferase n=1 Tax=Darwinula stevensoni TaxID=69355 RepID=A0A7R9AI06_9CRUS|nr:unnamed protein product [Darwinula stevensoni]CAG0904989.1 unnamed protein product [Darwinula stevensoni]